MKRTFFRYKKITASTLVETLVASVIIIVIFAIASLTLNNVLSSTVKSDTHSIDNHLNKLSYLYLHQKIKANYQESFEDYTISVSREVEGEKTFVVLSAVKNEASANVNSTKKEITKRFLDAKNP